ncbi:MAG: hypothetical protein ACREDR_36830 [Blastocatellia bacterium]
MKDSRRQHGHDKPAGKRYPSSPEEPAPDETSESQSEFDQHDVLLRQEIIESQKSQAEFLKWKFISAASVASVALG